MRKRFVSAADINSYVHDYYFQQYFRTQRLGQFVLNKMQEEGILTGEFRDEIAPMPSIFYCENEKFWVKFLEHFEIV